MMKMKSTILVCTMLLATPMLLAASTMKKEKAVFTEVNSLKWTPTATPGVELSVVEGDSANGPHHMYIKFGPGVAAPMHYHNADHYVSVVSGTLILTKDGKEHRMPAGSYFAFTGKAPHTTSCTSEAECVLFVDVRGKWDVVMVNDKK